MCIRDSYLVFITLVVPSLATWYSRGYRYLKAYLIGAAGYALGLLVSVAADLPSGPMIVCAMTAIGVAFFAISRRSAI